MNQKHKYFWCIIDSFWRNVLLTLFWKWCYLLICYYASPNIYLSVKEESKTMQRKARPVLTNTHPPINLSSCTMAKLNRYEINTCSEHNFRRQSIFFSFSTLFKFTKRKVKIDVCLAFCGTSLTHERNMWYKEVKEKQLKRFREKKRYGYETRTPNKIVKLKIEDNQKA